jgi:hypothetical protein
VIRDGARYRTRGNVFVESGQSTSVCGRQGQQVYIRELTWTYENGAVNEITVPD